MQRSEVVRTLYIGGQAAIAAEIVVIIGLFLFAIFVPDISIEQEHDSFQGLATFVDAFRE